MTFPKHAWEDVAQHMWESDEEDELECMGGSEAEEDPDGGSQ